MNIPKLVFIKDVKNVPTYVELAGRKEVKSCQLSEASVTLALKNGK